MSKKSKQEELFDAIDKDGVVESGVLNEVIIKETRRPDGSIRIQQDFRFCPSLAEQHTAHLTDINYLMEKYKPDEIAAYIAARSQHRPEITGHDFSKEPSLQEAHNIVYRSKQEFESLDDKVKHSFRNHLEFLKFIDNPANAETMVSMGLISKKQVDTILAPVTATQPADNTNDVGGKGGG